MQFRPVEGWGFDDAGDFNERVVEDGPGGKIAGMPPKTGAGVTRVSGGFRFEIGANHKRKPRKNVAMSIQNRLNARRGLAARVRAAKAWHRSSDGARLHRDLGHYNSTRSETFWGVIVPRALAEDASPEQQKTIDDVLDGLLRRLITIESTDVLQDVEFGDDGSVYLFFDPSLNGHEIDEVGRALRQEAASLALIASPDMSLPGESVASDWWVYYVPPQGESGAVARPDPRLYARDPATTAQAPALMVVKAAPMGVDQIALEIDVNKLIASLGEGVSDGTFGAAPFETAPAAGKVFPLWVPSGSRGLRLRDDRDVPVLMHEARLGRGSLFIVRECDYDSAVAVVDRGHMRRHGESLWTNLSRTDLCDFARNLTTKEGSQ